MKVAVISAQGDVSEHVEITEKAMNKLGIDGYVKATNSEEDVAESDAIILPGGESTTISKLIHASSVAEEIVKAAANGKPIMGTCAGTILLARHGDEQISKTKTKLLGLLDIWVKRNAFGRQRESFQATIEMKYVGSFEAVFIRAPAIVKTGENVEILATLDDNIVAVRENNILALTFHPELTDDTRIHEFFLKMR
ncbi:MAG: pyridoxal 5'-phosphate synthase glutaminase subunit PdxT [Thermoplasmata archaeon]|nr:pyridoxal 5'-phosphate synthase glutaminase subunit PdxT [Thermoplasmata archaeon]